MSRVAVVTDSTACIPPALLQCYQICVIPLHLIWGGEFFLDGVTIDPTTFYARLAAAKKIPTTAQPSVGEFVDFFTRAAPEAEAIVGVFSSNELSGTISSASRARAMLFERTIEVVDSRSTSMGLGFIVLAAARAAAQGKSLAEVVSVAQKLVPRTHVLFVVETLEYLHRGGRIGGASRWLGAALRIKPVLHLNEGRVDTLERLRTKGKAVTRMLDVMADRVGEAQTVHAAVIHANAFNEALALHDRIERRFACKMTPVVPLSPAVGTHVGPGTVGVAFYAD
jgi:DegV family protein with EDD domain